MIRTFGKYWFGLGIMRRGAAGDDVDDCVSLVMFEVWSLEFGSLEVWRFGGLAGLAVLLPFFFTVGMIV